MAIPQSEEERSIEMKGSLVIVGFFVLGVMCGYGGLFPIDLSGTDISFYALCALMFSVGISMGRDPQTWHNFRSLSVGLMLLPVLTIIGTLAGTTAVSIFLPLRSMSECLAVGSGFGYYSLSSIFITEMKGAELGTVALLANIYREIFTLLAAPLLARWLGKLAPIAAGGVTSMDTTLPTISIASGRDYVVVALFHGVILEFTVPFLVTFFCSL